MSVVIEKKEDTVDLSRISGVLDKFRGRRGAVIPVLQSVQAVYGYVPEASIPLIAEAINVYPSRIYGVLTFYAQFKLVPHAQHVIKVCRGTACHVMGSKNILDDLLKELELEEPGNSPDGLFSVEALACVGACALAPVILFGEEVHAKAASAFVLNYVRDVRAKAAEARKDAPAK